MPNDIRLGIRLTADAKGFVGEVRLARKKLDEFGESTEQARRKNQRFASTIGQLRKQFFAFAAGYLSVTAALSGTRSIVRAADAYTELNNRLRLVTDSENNLINTRQRLFEISQVTRTELAANTALYGRLSLASEGFSC